MTDWMSSFIVLGTNVCLLPGPDEVLAADSLITWHHDTAVKLRMDTSGPLAEKPISIPTMFQNTANKLPNHLAIGKYFSRAD